MTMARPRSTSTETKRVLCAAIPETLVFTLATACEADAIAIDAPTNNCSSVAREVYSTVQVANGHIGGAYLMSFIASMEP